MNENHIFLERKKNFLKGSFFILILTVVFMKLSDFNMIKGLLGIPKGIYWLFQNFIPEGYALAKLPEILSKLLETILLSVGATTLGAVFALILGILGSKITGINNIFSLISRGIGSIFRNIPEAVFAMIFLLSFGQNILTGYFALFFVSVGTLTRAFIETIDEGSKSSVEALESTGASFLTIIKTGVIIESMPQIISWILYMIETNIRSSTLIGILTGTGIGFLFDIYYKSMDYSVAGLIVICIIGAVILIEVLSNKIRRSIL